jgi:type IV secretion system coupling TraD/TrwB family protein
MLSDDLARSFYEWERRGRGWQLWPDYVDVEPPYLPFRRQHLAAPVIDDGRRPSIVAKVAQTLATLIRPPSTAAFDTANENSIEQQALSVPAIADWRELRLTFLPDVEISRSAVESFFVSLATIRSRIAFEIASTGSSISIQISAPSADANYVEEQLSFHFPQSIVRSTTTHLVDVWHAGSASNSLVIDFGLSREFMLPISAPQRFTTDPLTSLFAVMEGLEGSETAIYQILLQCVHQPWALNMYRAATLPNGSSLFADKPDFLTQTRLKISRPLFAVVVRVAVKAENASRVVEIGRNVAGALSNFANPVGNELIPLNNQGLNEEQREAELLYRATRRAGMILNLDELIALAHPPGSNILSAKLERINHRTKPAPPSALGDGVLLGFNLDRGNRSEVHVGTAGRLRHTHVIGASGTGKSSLLLNLIVQDAASGTGLGLLDPHGDLVDAVIARLPTSRIRDVILFDPSDPEFSVGFNVLQAHNELEKNLLASDLVAVFKRLATTWGDQMSSVLGNAILAFLESDRGGTLIELRRFLLESGFRNEFLNSVADQEIIYYWRYHFPMLKGAPVVSVLTRLDAFLRTKTIRHMVAQKDDRMDFTEIMDSGKIFLAKLSQGLIGEENSYLLGSLLVSKFHQAAMSRQAISQADRRPYFLYVDEFHHFATPSMVSILAGARKYGLGLTLAHQELRQLEDGNGNLLSAVLSNPYTRVCFRVGDQDARRLESGFSFFGANDLQTLSTGQAICRVERSDYDFNLETEAVSVVDEQIAIAAKTRVIKQTREKYALSREAVIELLAESRRLIAPEKAEPTAREETPASPTKPVPAVEECPPASSTSTAEPQTVPALPPQPSVTPGKGGREHKYLQQLIRQWGHGMGYLATVEKSVLDGAGLIDVTLEKTGRKVACEITITTPIENEIRNVRKCIEAGFDYVAVVAPDEKRLGKTEKAMRLALSEGELGKTRFFTPDALFAFVEELEAEDASKETNVRGYKVKVNYKTVDQVAKVDRTAVISKVLADTLKKSSGK